MLLIVIMKFQCPIYFRALYLPLFERKVTPISGVYMCFKQGAICRRGPRLEKWRPRLEVRRKSTVGVVV